MDDSLDDLYLHLSLTEQENEEVVTEPEKLEDAILYGGKFLIMNLLTKRHFNKDVFKSTMRKAWHLVR